MNSSEEEDDHVEIIKLEHQLSSHRHMIEQLERELQYKNSKIAQMEMKDNVPRPVEDHSLV